MSVRSSRRSSPRTRIDPTRRLDPTLPGRLAALAALALSVACAAPLPRVNEAHTRPPVWQTDPLSWEKLDRVERWLESPAAQVSPYWRVEGRLVLSEGRVTFAERDLGSSAADPAVLRSRLDLAREGFREVLLDPDASRSQADRARRGLDAARDLVGGTARPASSLTGGIVARESWGAAPAVPTRLDRAGSAYWRITVHHSAMPDPPPSGESLAASAAYVREIQRAHIQGRGYGDVGYHFLIDPAGRVFEGRALDWQGAHARGENNVGNVGICLLGNFEQERPTAAALASLKNLVDQLQRTFRIPRHEVHGHSHYGGTACPGRYLQSFVDQQW